MQKHVIKHFFKKTIFSSSSLGDTVIIAISGISIKRRYILNYRIRISILSIRVHADQEHVRPTTHSNLTDLDSFWQRITIRGNKIHSGFKTTAEEIVCLSRSHFISVLSVYSQPLLRDSPRSLSRYKLVWRLARAPPPSCYYYRVPQIYDGDMLDPVKQARSARDFISERGRGEVCFAGVHRRLLRMPPLPSFSSSSHIPFR